MDDGLFYSGFFQVPDRISARIAGMDDDGKIVFTSELGHRKEEDPLAFLLLIFHPRFQMVVIESDLANGDNVLAVRKEKLFYRHTCFLYRLFGKGLPIGWVVSHSGIVGIVLLRELHRLFARRDVAPDLGRVTDIVPGHFRDDRILSVGEFEEVGMGVGIENHILQGRQINHKTCTEREIQRGLLRLLSLAHEVLFEASVPARLGLTLMENVISGLYGTYEVLDIFSDKDFEHQSTSLLEKDIRDIEDGEVDFDRTVLIHSGLSGGGSSDIRGEAVELISL